MVPSQKAHEPTSSAMATTRLLVLRFVRFSTGQQTASELACEPAEATTGSSAGSSTAATVTTATTSV